MSLLDHCHREQLVQVFGILGNIISFFVYLAPLPTFRQIVGKKSTLGYQSVPYIVALFSSMLWMYYALIKKNSILLISINSIGCFIESLYIIVFLFYATREAKRNAIKLIVSLNICCFGSVLFFTLLRSDGALRIRVVAWICVIVAVGVFVAPLSIVWKVLQTRSVEFMPFALSCSLTLSAVMWFFYGLFKGDKFVAFPNVLGFLLGLVQIVLYWTYKNTPKIVSDEEKLPENIINVVVLGGPEVHPVNPSINEIENKSNKIEDEEKAQQVKSVGPLLEEPARTIVDLGPSPPVLVVCATG